MPPRSSLRLSISLKITLRLPNGESGSTPPQAETASTANNTSTLLNIIQTSHNKHDKSRTTALPGSVFYNTRGTRRVTVSAKKLKPPAARQSCPAAQAALSKDRRYASLAATAFRSEERRVGKECRSGWWWWHL